MHCDGCRHENPSGAKFCEACGARFVGSCAHCGAVLSAAARFCHACGRAQGAAADVPPLPSPQGLAPVGEAERRQLTVMFCDLVGSTELSTRLDPEDLREIVRGYQYAASVVVARHSGHIAQYLGDGLLIYFGYPEADEHDAERAIRAGLELLAAVPAVESRSMAAVGAHLAVRIGIHTGPVVVGDIGTGERAETLALGETPNVAARVQAIAQPNTVLITSATQRLVAGLFIVEEQGAHSLKGVRQALALYRVLQPSGARSRLDAARAHGLTSFVGREDELRVLWRAWERARAGEGQLVMVTGEAGIGKSRLVEALNTRVAGETHALWECRCSTYHQQSALRPLIELAERTFGFVREDSPAERFGKIAAGLTPLGLADAEALALWASLLSIPLPEDHVPLSMTPARQKQKTFDAIVRLMLAVAAQRPLLLLVEDLHWVDPSTLELLGILVDQVPTARVLLLLTARPEFRPPWGSRSHVTQTTLERLPRHHTTEMVERLTGGRSLPALLLEQIVARTDGVPLFVEELIKTVLESGASGAAPDRIPATLQDSLMARLDRLGPAKAVAQLGATLGRQFPYELLRAVSPLDEETLERELSRLVDAELLYQRGLPPQVIYLFKHALIQEAAYESLLRSTRSQYHRRIGVVLAERFPEIAEREPELLAQHFSAAGLAPEAVDYWRRAGLKAIQRSANLEASYHLERALEALGGLAEGPERDQLEIELLTALGPALIAARGFTAPEVRDTYERVHDLCRRAENVPQLFTALWGLWFFNFCSGRIKTAREIGEQFMGLAQCQPDPGVLVQAHHTLGPTFLALGPLTLARSHFEAAIALYDPLKHRAHAALYGGHDPGVCCRVHAALALWMLGYPELALRRAGEALPLAWELEQPTSVVLALGWTAILHQFRRDPESARTAAEAGLTISREHPMATYQMVAEFMRGWALARMGLRDEGLAEMRQTRAAMKAARMTMWGPLFCGMIAEVCDEAGRVEVGLAAVSEGLAMGDASGEVYHVAELNRLRGELLLLHHGDSAADDAAVCFRAAMEIARQQEARAWELRAAMSLTRLAQRQGRGAGARPRLAEIYAGFTEGFDTPDLRDARALLDTLA